MLRVTTKGVDGDMLFPSSMGVVVTIVRMQVMLKLYGVILVMKRRYQILKAHLMVLMKARLLEQIKSFKI